MSVHTLADAAAFRDALHHAGKRLVFTSGCFDVLHAGHTRYLAQARALGDALIIALNADASVSALKGPSRPVNSEADRAEVLLALKSVDAVLVFGESETTELIRHIRPHLFAKGGDYTLDTLNQNERRALEKIGAEIHLLPVVEGRSTTATLARMAQPENVPALPANSEEKAAEASASGQSEKRRPRLGILGSGEGSNFGVLLNAIEAGKLDAEVALVLSDNFHAPILDRAKVKGIPSAWVDPGEHPNRFSARAQEEVSRRFQEAGCDLVVCAGFMRRLKDPILTDYAGRIVNVHPSLLPAFPGRSAWAQAFDAGVEETGCTVHFIDAGIDTGPIIAQSKVPILPTDTVDDVRKRIQAAEYQLFPAALQQLLQTLPPRG